VAIDLALLEAHTRIERSDLGISEAFLRPRIGSDTTVAVLYDPLEQRQSEGWVICHSFGQEQSHLMEHEVAVARGLAAAGFPSLRIHGQGYGDSKGDPDAVGLRSHLADTHDAIELLVERTGIARVGALGARFGGLVAALAADREGLPLLALWEPVTQGSTYMRELLRTQAAFELTADDMAPEDDASAASILQELQANGWADVKGLRVSREAYDDIVAVSLERDMTAFSGDALIVGLSRSSSASPRLGKLAAHLRELGATCEETVVTDEQARAFGQYHYAGPDLAFKVDTQANMERALAQATVAWRQRRTAEAGAVEGSVR
jgi:alpha/beta superfamily hydrolase